MNEKETIPWYMHHLNLSLVARWLLDHNANTDDVLDMLEKPWHYDREFDEAEKEWRESK